MFLEKLSIGVDGEIKLDKEIIQKIERLISYVEEEELYDYMTTNTPNHIYLDAIRIKTWLKEVEKL